MIRNYFFTFLLLAICCQHSHAAVRYVNANVQGGGQDGTSWANAYPLLQSAIIASQYGDTIWVAHGTYRPTTGTNRNLSFSLKNGVRLFGGFSGTESSISERAWATYITTLSGDIGVLGDSTDNTYNVVYCNFADSTTILDGFTITGGNADSQASGPSTLRPKSGGGLYLVGSSILEDTRPTIANCTFLANYARFNGGGIFMRTVLGAGATPILKNCRFQDNTAANGGGIYKEGGSMLHETKVDSCTFIGNYAIYGGGFFFYNNNGVENVVIIKCDFRQNQVFAGGGGIYQEVYNDKCKMKIGGKLFYRVIPHYKNQRLSGVQAILFQTHLVLIVVRLYQILHKLKAR